MIFSRFCFEAVGKSLLSCNDASFKSNFRSKTLTASAPVRALKRLPYSKYFLEYSASRNICLNV